MQGARADLQQFLEELARQASPGDRLPPIRDLMRRFGASQQVVQRALQDLKSRGLIDSQVGRGTYFHGAAAAAAAAPRARSVLLLRRSISIVRGRALMDGLLQRFSAGGHRVLEVSYTDPDHGLQVLKGLPRFDACVVQSTFKILTLELLAALREKCSVLAVDGATLAGTDVEVVGMEWGEPLAAAVDLLQQHGHQRIAYASTSQLFLANQLGQRRFEQLQRARPALQGQMLLLPHLPGEDYEAALVDQIRQNLDADGRPPFTALAAWGIEDGARLRRLLAEIGLDVPSALSVVLLGRTDLVNEHAGFFDTIGCQVADQISSLHQAVVDRWADASRPYGVQLIPLAARAGQSVAAPAVAAPVQRGRSTRRTVSAVIASDSPT